MSEEIQRIRLCNHCGAVAARIGYCCVCDLSVCTECGNYQHRQGDKTVVHDECLGELEDDGFTMIKFVK
jgi:hypothetical protein